MTTDMDKYVVKMIGPDAAPRHGEDAEEIYNCSTLKEVAKEIEFQRIAFPYSCVYCIDLETRKRVDV